MNKIKFSDAEMANIIDLYVKQDTSTTKIGKIYNVSQPTIYRLLIESKIPIKGVGKYKLDVNETFFDEIDNEAASYYLGWMFSDGCIHEEIESFSIKIQNTDRYILESFVEKIQYKGNINTNSARAGNRQAQAALKIKSLKLIKRLIELGCVPRKSLVVEFPMLKIFQNDTLRHFLRGYFDGNGSIHIRKNGVVDFNIWGSPRITRSCKEILESLFDCEKMGFGIHKKKYGYVKTANRLNIQKLYDLFYKDSTLFLNRKRDKFEQISYLNPFT